MRTDKVAELRIAGSDKLSQLATHFGLWLLTKKGACLLYQPSNALFCYLDRPQHRRLLVRQQVAAAIHSPSSSPLEPSPAITCRSLLLRGGHVFLIHSSPACSPLKIYSNKVGLDGWPTLWKHTHSSFRELDFNRGSGQGLLKQFLSPHEMSCENH